MTAFRTFFPGPRVSTAGHGYIAGEAPDPGDPDSPDGRYRLLNVPARGRIEVYERDTMRCVASVLSAPDGTWRVSNLNEGTVFVVIGYDDRRLQNAAIQDWIVPATEAP